MISYTHENSESEIYACLKQVDLSMPRSISSRTHSLEAYAYKLYSSANVIIVRDEEEVLGICAFYTNRSDYAYLTLIAVSPQYCGRGYGGKLLGMAETAARKKMLPCMMLEVDSQNLAAIRFYSEHGYNCLINTKTNESIYMQKQLLLYNDDGGEKQ